MTIEITVFKGSKEGAIKQDKTQREDLKKDDVLVRVTHSGVCGTDLHYKGADMALGHEGTGVVEETGPDAHILKKGDRVGWGYEHDCKQNSLDRTPLAQIVNMPGIQAVVIANSA